MKNTYFTVGPSQVYPTVPRHLQEAIRSDILSLSHRGPAFKTLYEDTSLALRKLLGVPKNFHIFFTASALEAMERVIENTVAKKSVHFTSGNFGQKWYETAVELKKKPVKVELDLTQNTALSNSVIPKDTELFCITQNDTSTGVDIPMKDIRQLKDKHRNVLVALDVVSSVPYLTMDFSAVDIAFFSVQKGFGLMPGLGVLIVSDEAVVKARQLQQKGLDIGSYHSFVSLEKAELQWQTPETPNVLGIYLLHKVAEDMLTYGIERIRKETKEKAALLYEFFSTQPGFSPVVENAHFRSLTTIVVALQKGTPRLMEYLKGHGVLVGAGYGAHHDDQIRVANFPAHTLGDVKKLIGLIKRYNK